MPLSVARSQDILDLTMTPPPVACSQDILDLTRSSPPAVTLSHALDLEKSATLLVWVKVGFCVVNIFLWTYFSPSRTK
jgi:hypothetical protein